MATEQSSKLYYLKDKKLQIYKKKTVTDESGFSDTTVYIPVAAVPLWAYAKQLSQDQIFTAAVYGQSESRLFVIGYRTDIDIYDYVSYKGEWYSITRIDPPEDYKTDMFIYVKTCGRGDTPKDSDLKPYGYTG